MSDPLVDVIAATLAEHRLDDTTRTCTANDWKWTADAYGATYMDRRPGVLHDRHRASVLAERLRGEGWRRPEGRNPCSCGDPTRPHINHRKRIPCYTYSGTTRYEIQPDGSAKETR